VYEGVVFVYFGACFCALVGWCNWVELDIICYRCIIMGVMIRLLLIMFIIFVVVGFVGIVVCGFEISGDVGGLVIISSVGTMLMFSLFIEFVGCMIEGIF